jgi:hypothetical protein
VAASSLKWNGCGSNSAANRLISSASTRRPLEPLALRPQRARYATRRPEKRADRLSLVGVGCDPSQGGKSKCRLES